MMPENDQERRPIVITFNLKILVIVIVTIVLTFLFVRSNQTMTNTPKSVKTIYNTVDAEIMANSSKNRLVFPAVNVSMVTNSTNYIGTDHYFPQKQDGILRNDQEVTLSVTKEQPLNTNLQDIKEFRSEKTGLMQDDYFVVKPTLYWNKLNGYNMINSTIIDKNMPVYNVVDNRSEITAKNGVYQMDPGSNYINHKYSTIDLNIPLSEENDLNSHYNVNDSSYSSGSYKYKETEIPVDGIKLVTDGQPEELSTIENVSPPGSGSNAYGPHSNHDFKARYPTGQALYNRPSAKIPIKKRQPSKYVPDEGYYKPISQQLPSNISLKNNSALLLIILGILKLKKIGILQTIFILGFKLKLFFTAIFTKFLLLTKLVKFFKIIMLPVILLSSLSVFASMLNGTNNTLSSSSIQSSLLSMLIPSSFNNMGESSSSGSSSFSSSSSFPASSSSFSSSSSAIPGDIPPDILQLAGLSRESSGRLNTDTSYYEPGGILLPDLAPDGTIRSKIEPPYFTSKVQNSNVFRRQQYKSVEQFYPTLTIVQKILDSEKCVERIACRLAVAEKAGIIPLWVKLRILNSVSKLIPEEKYELYFKTYNFVNNAIETTKTSLIPDNWAEWCLERYNNDNITNRKK